jgi:hypothetical protein
MIVFIFLDLVVKFQKFLLLKGDKGHSSLKDDPVGLLVSDPANLFLCGEKEEGLFRNERVLPDIHME